jgi:hypothetical protein
MHQALGEFLTEMGRVEFRMLLLMDLINEAPIEALFDEYSGNPFGTKIKTFKKWCDFGGVPDEQKAALQKVYNDLDELLPKRNFLVHGETWERLVAMHVLATAPRSRRASSRSILSAFSQALSSSKVEPFRPRECGSS